MPEVAEGAPPTAETAEPVATCGTCGEVCRDDRYCRNVSCRECIWRRPCADCGTRFPARLEFYNSRGFRVCSDCAGDYFTCENCGEVRRDDDEYGGDGWCSYCFREEESEPSEPSEPIIYDHRARVPVDALGVGPHFKGVEVEVEVKDGYNSNDLARKVQDVLGDFVLIKSDGSLDHGFEIVTRPASLTEQRKRWAPFFDHPIRGLKSWNTTTCGIHVHASRAPLSEMQVAKMVCFTNASHNRRFITEIAGRSSGNWAKFKHKKLTDGSKCNPERYEAVNLQNVIPAHEATRYVLDSDGCRILNSSGLWKTETYKVPAAGTVEFRIFKGTLKRESVFKDIEFVDALISFCSAASRSLRESMSRVAFCTYVKRHREVWPHLAAFLDARWFGLETKATVALGFRTTVAQNTEQEQ